MFFKSLWPAFLWALFILIICAVPGEKIPRVDFLEWLKPDKLVHVFVFGLLIFLLAAGFTKQHSIASLKLHPLAWAVAMGVFYGILIEFLQATVFVNRSGDARDVLADALGAFPGIWYFKRWMKKRLPGNPSS